VITDGCPTIAPSAIVDPRENLSERPSASELANMAGVHRRGRFGCARGGQRRHVRVGTINHKHSKRVKRGRVIGSNPKAGSRRKNGARVALTVSRGKG
jgi:hypothetical protein